MSYKLAVLSRAAMAKRGPKKPRLTRVELLNLVDDPEYSDGRTKQAYKDECDINKIMARFATTDTITHISKHQGTYADFSDFDFFEQTQQLTKGREIFDDLPAEIRREFGQSPAAFFAHVNNPENQKLENYGLPALAKPGTQLPAVTPADADKDSRESAKPSLDVKPQETPPTPPVAPEAAKT